MTGLPNKEELRKLSEQRGPGHVSIYMPTARKGVETLQGPVRLKNLLRKAQDQVSEEKLLEEAWSLVDNYEFWQHQDDGLALLISPSGTHKFQLPFPIEEELFVNDRFHLKPLMRGHMKNDLFYLLTLSQRQIRLFEAHQFGLRSLALPDRIPKTLEEAMRYEDETRGHHFSPGSQGRHAGGIAPFSGHGVDASDKENLKADVLMFFKQIDRGVMELIAAENAPLLLAGLDYLHPIYREANTYPHLIADRGVHRAVDDMRPEELHELAWPVIEPMFEQDRENTLERFHTLRARGLASSDVREVVPAAMDGRVESLLVSVGDHQWGVFQPDTHRVELFHDRASAHGEDLLDLAAVNTMLHGGWVMAVDKDRLPEQTRMAAVFRY